MLGLIAVHVWLPAGRRRFVDIVPGIIFTLIAWLVGSTMFAAYLDRFSSYVTTYAGLASIMIAVVFLYIVSAIFILGGELNAAISRYFEARARVRAIGDQRRPERIGLFAGGRSRGARCCEGCASPGRRRRW